MNAVDAGATATQLSLTADYEPARLADDPRSQAHRDSVHLGDYLLLLPRRRRRDPDPHELHRRPTATLLTAETYNKAIHLPRRRHGVVLPDPVDSGDARQFSAAADDRRARRRVSAAESRELVPLHRRRTRSPSRASLRAASIPAGRSTRRSRTMYSNTHVMLMVDRAYSSPAFPRSSPASTSSSPCTSCAPRA